MERLVIYPGSFDPITNGHIDIIQRAAKLFDTVIVLLGINPKKQTMFSEAERIAMISDSLYGQVNNVAVDSYSGMIVEYAHTANACAIIRGLRGLTDFDVEFQMAHINKRIRSSIETIFLATEEAHMVVSSSMAKELARFGGDLKGIVPDVVARALRRKYHE